MLKKFYLYVLSLFVLFVSCDKEEVVPVAGIWGNVNSDGSVAHLIEFKNGAYMEYVNIATKLYYHDGKVWNASENSFYVYKSAYFINNGDLILDKHEGAKTISVSTDKLMLDGVEYQSVKGLEPKYGSEIILSVPGIEENSVKCSPSSQELNWEYEVSNIPKNSDLVVNSNVDWINNVVDKDRIRINLEENISSDIRTAVVTLSHPAAGTKEITILQLFTIHPAVVETLDPENVSYTQAVIKGTVADDGNGTIKNAGFYLGMDQEDLQKYPAETDDEGTFALTLSDLLDDATYYYKAFVENEVGESCGELCSFSTKKITVPYVQTGDVSEILPFSATVSGLIVDDCGAEIRECGFYYGTDPDPRVSGIKKAASSISNVFSLALKGLTDDTVYYFQAYAENQKGESLGEVLSFRSLPIYAPTVMTSSATDVAGTSARLNGKIISDGGTTLIERGFYYGKSQTAMKKISTSSMEANFSVTLTGLEDDTAYYFQAYAVNSVGETTGETMTFTTAKVTVPQVSTLASEYVQYTTAKVSGSINSDGGDTITEYGFYYRTASGTEKKVVAGDSVSGSFNVILTGLNDDTTYYYRAYAINSKGIAYGSTLSFTTLYDPYNGHEYVDLGLPSGTKWATVNIGASSPYEAGSLFQWGCIKTGDQGNPMFKYEGCISGTEYDAATVLWEGDWKIPTYTQALELFKYCKYEMVYEAGVRYYKLTSEYNNKSIILPAASHWTGTVGTYFSTSSGKAYKFYGNGFLDGSQAESEKFNQLSIRPVCK